MRVNRDTHRTIRKSAIPYCVELFFVLVLQIGEDRVEWKDANGSSREKGCQRVRIVR